MMSVPSPRAHSAATLQGMRQLVEAQGAPSLESGSCLWVEKRKFFFESVPPHRPIHLRTRDAARLFVHGAAAIRYTCEESEGTSSWEYICDTPNYDFASLAEDARRRVRRGLESCEVERIDCDLLAREGREINRSVLEKHGRDMQSFLTDEARWKKYMAVCAHLPFVEAYGVFVKRRFCAFSLAAHVDDYAYLLHTHAHTEYLKYSPMNALFFTVTKALLETPGVRIVSQGLESFAERPDLERFKLAMGFRKRALGRRVIVHPFARPIFSKPGAWLAGKVLASLKPGMEDDFATFAEAVRRRRFIAREAHA